MTFSIGELVDDFEAAAAYTVGAAVPAPFQPAAAHAVGAAHDLASEAEQGVTNIKHEAEQAAADIKAGLKTSLAWAPWVVGGAVVVVVLFVAAPYVTPFLRSRS